MLSVQHVILSMKTPTSHDILYQCTGRILNQVGKRKILLKNFYQCSFLKTYKIYIKIWWKTNVL